jgi:hypothetical protein
MFFEKYFALALFTVQLRNRKRVVGEALVVIY